MFVRLVSINGAMLEPCVFIVHNCAHKNYLNYRKC
uniref:Uncharacterized protein n=1 Tax=Anguilla anguilla TaxID=7936 RepID=A0A0E9Q506_ANGAN